MMGMLYNGWFEIWRRFSNGFAGIWEGKAGALRYMYRKKNKRGGKAGNEEKRIFSVCDYAVACAICAGRWA
ncbi:MAG: hypothetical protein IJ337_09320, partial [Clostridia bacterium]|nr:hypothetical protein [Clostridia bacterium]